MVALQKTFRTAEIAQQPLIEEKKWDPIAEGWYDSMIVNADVRDTKAGTGQYIAIRFDVTGPTNEGRVIFTNINISNPNPKAVEIGHQQLARITEIASISELTDTDQLIGSSMSIKVTIKSDDQYGDRNEIRGYRDSNAKQSMSKASAAAPPWAAKPAEGLDDDIPF
mgnify:CR=1 FL=1|tara:strand:+ start:1913 stop:2413 length:501 start_codon:yes stop_codon:yes gene_type:complete